MLLPQFGHQTYPFSLRYPKALPLLLPVPLKPEGLRLQAAIPPFGMIDPVGGFADSFEQWPSEGGELGVIGGDGGPEASGGKRTAGGSGWGVVRVFW